MNTTHFTKAILPLLFFVLSLPCKAEWVPADRALSTAQAFWNQKVARNSSNQLRLAWDNLQLHPQQRTAGDKPLYYVFSGVSNGFVIIAAEDQVNPILAYAFDRPMSDPTDLPYGLQDWLTEVGKQIEEVRTEKIENPLAQKAWSSILKIQPKVLLETAKWNQFEPYNNEMPRHDGQRSATGCVNTSLAIVLRYYQWPKQGKGTTPAFTTRTHQIKVPARDLNHTYDWEHMPLTYTNGYSTETENKAISTLMADIAYTNVSDFGKSGTYTNWHQTEFFEHFNFGPTVRAYRRSMMTEPAWFALLENELDARRPVIYIGGKFESHQYVLDGYTADHYFHVNWGWGGRSDGYYSLNNLKPRGMDLDFGSYAYAYINVKPNTGNLDEDLKHWIEFNYTGYEIDKIEDYSQPFYIRYMTLSNTTQFDFTGHVKGAHVDKTGRLKSWVTPEIPLKLKKANYNYLNYTDIRITQPIEFGDKLHFYFKAKQQTEWNLIGGYEYTTPWEIPIADEYDIAGSTSFGFNKKSGRITLHTKEGVTATLFTAEGQQVHQGIYLQDANIVIETKELEKVPHVLQLQKGDDIKKITISVNAF